MTTTDILDRQERRRRFAERRAFREFRRGLPPVLRLAGSGVNWNAVLVVVVIAAVAFFGFGSQIGALLKDPKIARPLEVAIIVAWLVPAALWAYGSLKQEEFVTLTRAGKWVAFSYGVGFALFLVSFFTRSHAQRLFIAHLGLTGARIPIAILLFAATLGAAAVLGLLRLQGRSLRPLRLRLNAKSAPDAKRGLGVWLGTATGMLAQLGHNAGIAGGGRVTLFFEDLARNILILGGIGEGKTTRAISPILLQLLDQQTGGLIFDIKGDFVNGVRAIAEDLHRDVIEIGVGAEPMNLTAGLTPEIAASFLKSAFLLGGTPRDTFWVDSAAELCRNGLGVLTYLPDRYSLSGLYSFIFNDDKRDVWTSEARERLASMPDATSLESRRLEKYLEYFENIYKKFEPKVRSNIVAQVAQALSPFTLPELEDAFCHAEGRSMQQILDDGEVFVVRLPIAVYGLAARLAYTMIKLRFFNMMQRRRQEPTWNQERAVFFMCDEYQEIVSGSKDGLSDLSFWDKSRSSGCIGIVSAQGISSFYSSIGNKEVADTVLQNFRQKLCFRTEDQATLNYMSQVLGQIDRGRFGENSGSSTGGQGSTHSGTSLSFTRENLINPQFFRTLPPNGMLALLSVSGHSFDDVLITEPVYD